MNQLPASLYYESPAIELQAFTSRRTLSQSNVFSLRKNQGPVDPTDFETVAFWTGIYDLRGGALQPWDGSALLSPSRELPPGRDAQTAQAVEDAIIAERSRLARELHDAVTQTLFAASLIAEVLPDLWKLDEAEACKSTDELRQLTRGALAEMRTLLFELRPAALKQARLPDLLRQLREAVMGRKGLPIQLIIEGDCEIPCDVKVEMYRIVQESLNNIVKYARAKSVEIRLKLETAQVHLQIRDNGIGFDLTSVKPTSLGLRIMRERAEIIHAQLQVTSQPGLGTTISLEWQA